MKKLLTLLLVLVCSVSWGAGTTTEDRSGTTLKIGRIETVSFKYTDSSSVPIAAGASVTASFDTKKWDTHNAFDGSTFTAPTTGIYEFSGLAVFYPGATEPVASAAKIVAEICVDGAPAYTTGILAAAGNRELYSIPILCRLQLTAGEHITLVVTNYTTSTGVIAGFATRSWFGGELLKTY